MGFGNKMILKEGQFQRYQQFYGRNKKFLWDTLMYQNQSSIINNRGPTTCVHQNYPHRKNPLRRPKIEGNNILYPTINHISTATLSPFHLFFSREPPTNKKLGSPIAFNPPTRKGPEPLVQQLQTRPPGSFV